MFLPEYAWVKFPSAKEISKLYTLQSKQFHADCELYLYIRVRENLLWNYIIKYNSYWKHAPSIIISAILHFQSHYFRNKLLFVVVLASVQHEWNCHKIMSCRDEIPSQGDYIDLLLKWNGKRRDKIVWRAVKKIICQFAGSVCDWWWFIEMP
jgi:hypothetical protein